MIRMKQAVAVTFLIILSISALPAGETIYSPQNQLDINRSSFEAISALPVSDSIARRLYERVLYKGYFNSIYELQEIEGMNPALFNKLKPLIRIEPFQPVSSVQEKIEEIYYRLDRWSSGEGVNDAFVDLWIEKALDPMNVNNARYDQLVNLQNISPLDAVAIINYRQSLHWIRDERDLRRAPGLSNYAYRSASNFLDYKDSPAKNWHGHVLMRVDNTPFMADEGEQTQEAGLTAVSSSIKTGYNSLPNLYYKTRLSYGQNYKIGISYHRNINEPNYYYSGGAVRIPKFKYYAGIENMSWGDFNLRKLYLGYYKVTFGQGVIMENTDFFTPRKSGYGFRKRFDGLSGDNSRTRQYTLRGVAAEADYSNFSALGFISYDSRDAVLNRSPYSEEAGTGFSQLIVLDQRFEYALDDPVRAADSLDLSWLDAVHELTYGGHVQYDFVPGTYFGLSYYESAYDRVLDPDPYEIVGTDYQGNQNWDIRQVAADSEIKQTYGGDIARGSNPLWADALSFRRVYGFDFQTVINNIAIQGEYGELDKGGSFLKMGDDPKALVLSAYLQYDNFNMLALYRDYDVGFDNPYQRSFSNYRRFKGSIFEDYYYLQSVLYGQLYENNPQPQAEKGYYLNAYYQINRQFNTRFEYDNWLRQPDAAEHYRLVGTVSYRPVYALTIQLRNKWQAREELNDWTPNQFYRNGEFRGRLRMRLSNYDNLDLMYASSRLVVHPRPRVFGDIVLDGEAITANYVHNFNSNFKVSGMLAYYKGFLWNFEDTQFMVMDSRRGALRYWMSFYMRMNHNLSMRFKYTADHHKPVNNIRFEPWDATLQDNPGRMFAAPWNRTFSNLYYVELNYHF